MTPPSTRRRRGLRPGVVEGRVTACQVYVGIWSAPPPTPWGSTPAARPLRSVSVTGEALTSLPDWCSAGPPTRCPRLVPAATQYHQNRATVRGTARQSDRNNVVSRAHSINTYIGRTGAELPLRHARRDPRHSQVRTCTSTTRRTRSVVPDPFQPGSQMWTTSGGGILGTPSGQRHRDAQVRSASRIRSADQGTSC